MAAILDMQISWFSNFEPSEGVQKKFCEDRMNIRDWRAFTLYTDQ